MNDAKQATPAAELERQICSATEPKNEREWWAHHEIARLRDRLAVETLALVETIARAERAETEAAGLRAYAERYRWLRGDQCDIVVGTNPGAMDYGMSGVSGTYDDWLGGDELDAAIDAARGES